MTASRRNIVSRAVTMSAVLVFALTVTSCTTVINETADTDVAVDTSAPSAVTTLPQGDIESLLSQLVNSANGLGEAIANRQSARANQQAADAEAIWSVLQPQLIETGLDVVEDIDRMVELMQTAVDRRRPADADKAFRFISIIADEIPSLL
jgi:hypothetical protein